jgi:hypothetical protein
MTDLQMKCDSVPFIRGCGVSISLTHCDDGPLNEMHELGFGSVFMETVEREALNERRG